MTYNKTVWVDQEVKKERTYELINNSDGTTTIQDPPNNILTFGTPVNAQNLNNIENGIEDHEIRISRLEGIGNPIPTLSNILAENEIWLEGAEVSKTTYSALYAVYGDTYGTAESEDNFVLPDFRGRVLWGAGSDDNFGYIEAGLPNITGTFHCTNIIFETGSSGAFTYTQKNTGTLDTSGALGTQYTNLNDFNASRSSSIYGNSTTVQPPSVKVRVKTRFA